jgi:hypothetical protein
VSAAGFSRRIVAQHRPLAAQSPAAPQVHRLTGGRRQLAWALSSRLDLSVHLPGLQRLMQFLGIRMDGRMTVLSRPTETAVRREIERAGPPAATVLRSHTAVERVIDRATSHVRDSREVRHEIRDIRSLQSVQTQRLGVRDHRTAGVRALAIPARTVVQRTVFERSFGRQTPASSFFAGSSSRLDLRREIREAARIERLRSTSLGKDVRERLAIRPPVLLPLSATAGGRGGRGPAGENGKDGTSGASGASGASASIATIASTIWKPVPAPVAAPVPPRPAASAEVPRSVASLQERRLVEVVQREVKGVLASAPPLSRLTREDYGQIADRVYTDLTRRLTVERERREV